ncbi:transmembrane protein 233-like [Halichondria panicea]|uniref:transmembrane protein 233-like n=1 Tax=Halichondria panicea TaxID=6063 RepID=UPI00312BB9E9
MTDYNTPFPTAPPPQHAQHVNPPSYSESPQSYGSTNYAPGYQGGAGYQQQQPYNTAYPPSTYQPAPLVYNTTNTTVVNTQPNLPIYHAPKPSSYIWLSVIAMLCCCFVLGLIALIVGLEVDNAYNCGNDARAKEKSKKALGFSISAIAFGVVIHLSWIGYVIYLVA